MLNLKPVLRAFLGIVLTFSLLVLAPVAHADTATSNTTTAQDICFPQPDANQQQYIIGYGSLMQDASRKRSAPTAGTAYPVLVKGYQRGWFAKGGAPGFDTTYLGAIPDPESSLNAVIYQVTSLSDITTVDQREYFYCRQLVKPSDFTILGNASPTIEGQAWIYVNKLESIAPATVTYPIVESYVDIFISGCLEQEQRYNIPDFAKQCVNTTKGWSEHWVNDRIYPRRPFIYEPKATQIDRLLKAQIPLFFSKISIEE